MRQLPFSKYHGLENDFLVIPAEKIRLRGARLQSAVRAICDRHTGVGADGVLLLGRRAERFSMRIYNADGSEAEISGNGLRILAQHISRMQFTRKRRLTVATVAGPAEVRILGRSGNRQITQIQLPRAKFELSEVPMRGDSHVFVAKRFAVETGALIGTAVSVGNPHIVFFVDSFDFDWIDFGAQVEMDRRFPQGTNVEFVVRKTRRRLLHRSWERGVGLTRASGTGAAAAAAAGVICGLADKEVTVIEPAGELKIEITSLEEPMLLSGPSVFIADGTYYYVPDESSSQ
jgi:diaminopimelate epimerase